MDGIPTLTRTNECAPDVATAKDNFNVPAVLRNAGVGANAVVDRVATKATRRVRRTDNWTMTLVRTAVSVVFFAGSPAEAKSKSEPSCISIALAEMKPRVLVSRRLLVLTLVDWE